MNPKPLSETRRLIVPVIADAIEVAFVVCRRERGIAEQGSLA
jgi:hypothetical protein